MDMSILLLKDAQIIPDTVTNLLILQERAFALSCPMKNNNEVNNNENEKCFFDIVVTFGVFFSITLDFV